MTKIINDHRRKESGFQVPTPRCWGAGFAGGKRQPGAKGRIEPFNVSDIETAQVRLTGLGQLFGCWLRTMQIATGQPHASCARHSV